MTIAQQWYLIILYYNSALNYKQNLCNRSLVIPVKTTRSVVKTGIYY